MKLSQLYTKTSKDVSTQTESKNAQLLTRAGFIYQEMAGVYAYLPLGLKVIQKISTIVREAMDVVSTETLLPSLSPTERWHNTDRLETIDVLIGTKGANKLALAKNDAEYILNPTHEDVITPIAKHFRNSYKDFPFSTYQIQNKFRNEPRAKSGVLRGREFIMKDLYSFHTSEKSLMEFYENMKIVYKGVYEKLGIGDDTFLTYASGGDFTTNYSHEFQTLLEEGEDTIYLDRKNKIAYNKEVTTPADAKKLGVDFSNLEIVSASEVGNIFPLGTKFSKALDYYYTDKDNKKGLVWMGSYGIGISRLMGVVTEKLSDDKGLVWPESIAPFKFHIVALADKNNFEVAQKLYKTLGTQNCLYDDRDDASAGQKFADADLIGCPIQIVVSKKSLEQGCVEIRSRTEGFELKLVNIADIKSDTKF